MSRLWSRFGIRALAVALLASGVGGGFYLAQDQETQQQGISAQLAADADQEEIEYIKERHREHVIATAHQREAQLIAAEKAAATAKAEAERAQKAAEAASRKKREEQQAQEAKEKAEAEANAGPKPYTGAIPTSCNQYSGNRKIGCAVMLSSGFGLDQFPCLDKLWTKESGWNYKASNPSSGAYGIPQALPGSKMATAGSDWKTNPATQVKWGLSYIKGRYGDPCGAWAHSQDVGWY